MSHYNRESIEKEHSKTFWEDVRDIYAYGRKWGKASRLSTIYHALRLAIEWHS